VSFPRHSRGGGNPDFFFLDVLNFFTNEPIKEIKDVDKVGEYQMLLPFSQTVIARSKATKQSPDISTENYYSKSGFMEKFVENAKILYFCLEVLI